MRLLILLHSPLNTIRGVNNSSLCRACVSADETPTHVMLESKGVADQRKAYMEFPATFLIVRDLRKAAREIKKETLFSQLNLSIPYLDWWEASALASYHPAGQDMWLSDVAFPVGCRVESIKPRNCKGKAKPRRPTASFTAFKFASRGEGETF
ncbi:jg6368 [Pararge aegeria aegeria]|uniref:Jg6368 protein n=1 Tax=Pararge aegeria aegeria TaxID=348720 RepID=A0A8S4RSN0_9NEOP|nr:jg6368 [Pararge aegeria aegeria]